jgi:hypothetical protein
VVRLGDLDDGPICLECGGSIEWDGLRWRHLGTVPDHHPAERSTKFAEAARRLARGERGD